MPVQTPGDHQMDDEPEIMFESDGDSLAKAMKRLDSMPLQAGNGWIHGSQEKRTPDPDALQPLADDSAF